MDDKEAKRAMDKALHYLGFRSRSVAQMRTYLEKKGFSPEAIESVVEKLEGYSYLNDAKFAESLVESATRNKGVGARIAKQKLYQSGIDAEISQAALDAISPETERENAKAWAEKILPKLRDEDLRKRREKLYRRLISKGFSHEIVRETLQETDWENDGSGGEDV